MNRKNWKDYQRALRLVNSEVGVYRSSAWFRLPPEIRVDALVAKGILKLNASKVAV